MRIRFFATALVASIFAVTTLGCSVGDAKTGGSSSTAARPSASGGCSYQRFGEASKPVDPPPASPAHASGTLAATVKMSEGSFVISMDRAKAPCTVNSFESLARQKFFDGTRCHRLVVSGIFILQCGDPSGSGHGGPGYRFGDELDAAKALKQGGGAGVIYPAGTVAMANSGPDTNGSQIFLVYKDTGLPPLYTVFGTIDAAGLSTVTQIADMGVKAGSESDPIAKATIESVTLG